MMMSDVVWTWQAENHLQKIYSRLEDSQPGAGDILYEEIDKALQLIKQFPEMAQVFQPPVRRWIIGKYRKFGLFYSPEKRGIVVLGLLDLRQSSESIRRELGF